MKPILTSIVAVLVLGLASACSNMAQPPQVSRDGSADPLQAAWVVIGAQGEATARAITLAASCPVLMQDGVPGDMHVRALSGTEPQRRISRSSSAMSSDKPADFPVLTCEAVLKPGIVAASIAGKKLPVPSAAPLRILVLGDTGCRLKAESNYFQPCNDPAKWAFGAVARTAARFAPDLVIHVGDYQYRENPCPSGIGACAGSPWGFGWDTWQADFFSPAAPLLAAAPWVMVRGNHESCARAGQGWWRFLDPRTLLTGRDCNRAEDDMQGDFSAPYAVSVGGGAQLIVFDSSRTGAQPLAKNDPVYAIYREQFRQVDQLAAQADFSIFIEHHPILGFAPEPGKSGAVAVRPGNAALQSVLEDLHPDRLFDPRVQLLLAGHVHLFEAITFAGDHPMQLVTGNGGSSPDIDLPEALPAGATPYVHASVAHFNSTSRSGFTTMERVSATSTEWTVKAWDQQGVLMTTCSVSKVKKVCF